MSYPLPLTRTEAYLAYKAGVIQQSELKPSLAVPRIGIDAWLAYWTELTNDYPKNPDGTPMILQEEEAYIAYLCGVTDTYPEKCLRRVGAYLRYLISARWGRPDHPLNREELYLSLIKTQFIPSGDPSSDIEIDGTAKAPFVDVKMYGDTFQQSYEGKNLLNFNSWKEDSVERAGVTWSVSDDETIVSSGTSTGNYSACFYQFTESGMDVPTGIPEGTYYAKLLSGNSNLQLYGLCRQSGSSETVILLPRTDANTKVSFDIGSTTTSVRFRIVAKDTGLNCAGASRIILSSDESFVDAGEFEPYVGGTPSPNPDYPQPVQTVTGSQTVTVTGKNIFDGQLEIGGWVISTGQTSVHATNNNAYRCVNPIPVEPSSTYSFSVNDSRFDGFRVIFCDSNMTVLSSVVINTTIVTPADCAYITFYSSALKTQFPDLSDIKTTQLEKGSDVSAYTPYSKTDYHIDLGDIKLCGLGDDGSGNPLYEDYIYQDMDEWKVHKETANITLDNTADTSHWSKSNSTANNVYINQNIPGLAKESPLAANNLTVYNTSDIYNNNIVGICYNTTGQGLASIRIGVGLSGASTVGLFKSWLEENPVTAYYALATPTDTVITDQNLINQLNALKKGGSEEGTTYIRVSAPDPNLPAKLYVEAAKYV